ncbi:competence type IV pilus minor pilin ComGD [Sporosarcina koreensis]|uniref:Competence type IV pilus minor pilin ComGD n=1 Tax=Sporosarcina koreensis TaxID=334735 RepID=A0ABW0TXT6_9BACL
MVSLRDIKNNEVGFTFLEMLLVLSVVAVLTAVILPIGDRWITKQSEKEALYTFIATIHHAQAYAMANETRTAIRFRNSGKSYSLFAPSTVTYSTIDFPEGMHLFNGHTIEFHPDGQIVNPGTIILRTTNGDKRLTLQLQHGRVIVYE